MTEVAALGSSMGGLSQKLCEAHVCWLSVPLSASGCLPLAVCIWLSASGCLPPAVCIWLSAVQWIVVARELRVSSACSSFQCQCLQLLMMLPVIQCCLQCSQILPGSPSVGL